MSSKTVLGHKGRGQGHIYILTDILTDILSDQGTRLLGLGSPTYLDVKIVCPMMIDLDTSDTL